MAQSPGEGFLGWLGRQIGHVKKAVKSDVVPPQPKPTVIYRTDAVEEVTHPTDSELILRRTTIDEVIEKPRKSNSDK